MENIVEKILAIIAIIIIASLLISFPVMWLWNGVMPELFGTKEIGFWMALKISLLSTMLFKSYSSDSKD